MRGISSLGLCHPRYEVERLIRCFSNADYIVFGWLDKFFNARGSRNAIQVMSQPKRKVVRVHIINGPGLNNRRVQPHEITYGYTHATLVRAIKRGDEAFLRKFRRRCRHIREVCSYAPAGTLNHLSVSPWLEHGRISAQVFDILAEIVREELGGVDGFVGTVGNPVKGRVVGGSFSERHGDRLEADIIDLDGIDYRAANMSRFKELARRADIAYIWSWSDNGLTLGGKWKKPEERRDFSHQGRWEAYQKWVENG